MKLSKLMGCVSSKQVRKELKQEILKNHGDPNHVVSLTSSTYGVLQLDRDPLSGSKRSANGVIKSSPQRTGIEEPEIINAWELMEDLEDEIQCYSPVKKFPKSPPVIFQLISEPSMISNQVKTTLKQRSYGGKENKQKQKQSFNGGKENKQVLKPLNCFENSQKLVPNSKSEMKKVYPDLRIESFRKSSGFSSSKGSYSPLFDPELLASLERELAEEKKQRKCMVGKMVSPKCNYSKTQNPDFLLESFEKKCPPRGENSVILYTTTLRGIRKTFEDCNMVRSAIESHRVRMIERDISMDSGFREELRILMGSRDVKVPLVFVKGRLIGGGEEILKMEEEGKLGYLFQGLPMAESGCEACGGVRFVMCRDCNGSCKALDEEMKVIRCGECNENGLIKCSICC